MAKVERVLAEDPGILEAHLILGNLFVKQEEWDGAIGAYREALSLDPEYKSAILGLADAYRLAARYDEAAAGYRRLLELDPNDNKAFYHLAEIHAAREEYEEALEVLAGLEATGEERAPGAQSEGPESPEPGTARRGRGRAAPRARDGRSALGRLVQPGALFEERGDGSRAIEAYETRLEMAPKDFRSHFNVAKLYGALGDPERMEGVVPGRPRAQRRVRGRVSLSVQGAAGSGRTGEAEETALRGLALEPEPEMAPLGHLVLADVYNRQGRTAEAEREVRRAQSYRR